MAKLTAKFGGIGEAIVVPATKRVQANFNAFVRSGDETYLTGTDLRSSVIPVKGGRKLTAKKITLKRALIELGAEGFMKSK